MRKPKLAILAVAVLFVCNFLFVSCGKDKITQIEEQSGDYDLLYIHAGGGLNVPLNSLRFSTKTCEVSDTMKTPYVIDDLQFTRNGTMAVLNIWDQFTGAPSVISINYPSMDTIGLRESVGGNKIYYSPDEQAVLTCGGSQLSILTFPDLTPILIQTVNNYEGGFLTSGDSAFYLVSGIDSIFIVDYSDRQNITITTNTIGSISGGGTMPGPCVVDYENKRLILVSNYNDEKSYIHILNSNDLSLIQFLVVNRLYNGTPGVRPESNEIYFKLSGLLGDNNSNYMDIYDVGSNTLKTYINFNNISFTGYSLPHQIEFTPDGRTIYVSMGSNQYAHYSVLEFRPGNVELVHELGPDHNAHGYLIRINPIDKSK